MNKFNDESPKNRLLLILKSLLECPYYFTRRMLSTRYNVSIDTIKKDFEELRNADFNVNFDTKNRYGIIPNKSTGNLEEMLFFNETEKDLLIEAISKNNSIDKRLSKIVQKLETIYDVSKLGSSLFSNTFLNKVSLLEKSKEQKCVVKLINYRSTNSSEVSDKLVEAFSVGTKEDILHAFDIEKKEIRHYRISRIERIEMQKTVWEFENRQIVMATDPFRIVNNKQVRVHIKLKVGGYNELTERFPLTQAYLQPSANEAGVFEFECKVNEKFYGLTNFILGYHEHVLEIIEPESLINHIREHTGKINF